jgi:hypothetical protein
MRATRYGRCRMQEYKERGKKTDAPNEIREIKNLGRTFTEMADIFGPSDNAVIRLRVLRVSQAPGSSMSACHGKHRAVDLLARSRDHSGRPDGGSEQRHESCELSRRGCSKMPTLRFRDQEIAKLNQVAWKWCTGPCPDPISILSAAGARPSHNPWRCAPPRQNRDPLPGRPRIAEDRVQPDLQFRQKWRWTGAVQRGCVRTADIPDYPAFIDLDHYIKALRVGSTALAVRPRARCCCRRAPARHRPAARSRAADRAGKRCHPLRCRSPASSTTRSTASAAFPWPATLTSEARFIAGVKTKNTFAPSAAPRRARR